MIDRETAIAAVMEIWPLMEFYSNDRKGAERVVDVILALDASDAGVSAAVSWSHCTHERPVESLLRIRRELKEPRGWWTPQDDADWRAAGLLDLENRS